MHRDNIKVLDYGYVRYINHMGTDEEIIESARMSTAKGFLGWGTPDMPGDEKLLKYLYDNKHATPFEMVSLHIEIKAPIFVFREWHRHRTQSYQEMSARYVPLPNENYMPTVERLMMSGGTNKQASGTGKDLPAADAQLFCDNLETTYEHVESLYQDAIASGIPKELARLIIPVGRYSCMRASANLRNWLAFLTLREAPNAQWEIRQYAHVVSQIIRELWPRTWALYAGSAK